MPKIGSAKDRILARSSALEEDRKKQNEQQQTKQQQTKLQKITTAKQRIQKRAAALEQERKKQMQNAPAATNPTVNTPSSTNRVEESVKPAQKVNRRFQTVAERAADKQASTNPRANGNSGGESTGRVSKGVQSIGLKIPATFEYLIEGAKTARDNAAEYQNSELKERADAALNDIKLAKVLYGEGSEQHLKAQADYDALRKEIVAYQKSPDKVVDANSRASQFMSGVQKLQEEALEGTSGVVRDLGEIALSMGNTLALMPFNAILPGATLAMMGAEAAADRAYELQQRGVTADSAMTRGLVAGGIEALTEKIGLDNLMDIVKVGGKSVLMNIAKQAMAEGGEEGLSYAMNYLADKAAGDPEAAFVLNDFAKSIGMGAVSGALFGAGGTAIYALGNQPEADFIQQTGRARTTPDEISLHLQQSDPVMEQAMQMLQEKMGESNAENVLANTENVLDERQNTVSRPAGIPQQANAMQDDRMVTREEKVQQEQPVQQESAPAPVPINVMSDNTPIRQQRIAEAKAFERSLGYGEKGMEAFNQIVEESGESPQQVRRFFQTAYETGMTGLPVEKAHIVTDVQRKAYYAGLADANIQAKAAQESAKLARTHQNAGFNPDDTSTDNLPKGMKLAAKPADVTDSQVQIVDNLAKKLGVRVRLVSGDSIQGNAEIHGNEVYISETFNRVQGGQNRSLVFYAAHEIGMHRLMKLAPDEGRAFINAIIQDKNSSRPSTASTVSQIRQEAYAEQGVDLSTVAAMEEISADSIMGLYESDEAFSEAIERVFSGNDEQAKEGARQYKNALDFVIQKLKEFIGKLTGKSKTEAKQALSELEHQRDLYERALKAAMDKSKGMQATKNATQEGDVSVQHSIEDAMRKQQEDGQHSLKNDLTAEQQKHYDFNQRQTATGSTLRTLKGSPIKRSKYGVGKEIGGTIYLHKDYATEAIPAATYRKAVAILHQERPGFQYNSVMWNPKTEAVRFDEAPDFNTAREPVVGNTVTVIPATGTVKDGYSNYIWHHKWIWVKNDYKGFNVRESWEWSKRWLSVLPVASDGNGIDRWNAQLDAYGLPRDGAQYSLKDANAPVEQAITSAKTSIMQIPALFKHKAVVFGKTNVDIGGGRFDLAKNYLAERGTKSMIFDPYNRGAQENSETLAFLQSGKRADTATCANVLNVIAEPAARSNVILEAAKAIKPDGTAYFMVYEGNGTGIGKQTSSGWQNNRMTADYVDEIRRWFRNVETVSATGKPTEKGKLIVAKNPVADLPKAAWEIQPGEAVMYSLKDDPIKMEQDLDALRQQRDELQDEIDVAYLDDLPQSDINKLENRMVKLNAEIYKLVAQERKAAVKTSMNDILSNLGAYRRSDLESLAEQISDGNWDGYEDLSRAELEDALREEIEAMELSPLEMQSKKKGLYVRPVGQPQFSLKAGDEGATFEENGVKYSIKSLRHDITEGRMFDDLVTAKVFNQKEADLLKQNLDKLVSYMLPNANILDMNEEYGKGNRPYSAYKPNSDPLYVISLDFSTLCRKRLMTQYVIEQLQLRENRPMTAEEQIAVRSMLLDYRQQEQALQVACAMCYVEAARLKAPKQMERFFNDTEAIMRKYFAKKDKAFNDKVREAQAKFKRDHGYDENATKKDMSGKDTKALNEMSARMRKEYTPDAKQQAIIDKAKSLPRSTFLTAGNLTALAIDQPDIYAAYTDHIRASTRSKSLESDIPYYYGDSQGQVTDTFIDSVNAENGMRFDSWSDFQMKHMLDMITAVIDLSVRGSKMHGYTKFPEMVRIFGKTGMMFNLSGVTEGNGFDANGNLLFSNTEGIDIVEARKLLRDFPETAGLQCIGVSDDHVRALLRADYVDYVIPYHTSGMNATLRKMAGINAWKDYTSTQHARKDPKAKKPANADKWQVEPVWSEFYVPEGKNGLDIMRKTAQRYIDMCHERGLIPKFDQFMDEPGYWKLLVDRKMVNQVTGEIVEQKPVKPIFDFDLIKQEIDREVSQYDPQLEKRALKYVVDNFDAVHQRIRDLKKGHPKKPMLKMANEILQAYAEGSNVQHSLKDDASIEEMQAYLDKLNTEYRGLEQQDARFKEAPEYKALVDAISVSRSGKKSLFDKPEALTKALDDYSVWQNESGYTEVIRRMEDMRGEMKTVRGRLDRSKEQAAKDAKVAYRSQYNEEFAKKYATKAAKKFGTTSRFDFAGYLTVNGSLLNFSGGQGYRIHDHREVAEVLDFLPEDHGYSDGMIEFMNLGNIRLQSYGIDIAKAPNAAQKAKLRQFFRSLDGEVSVDFSNENGDNMGSLEYNEGTRAERILNDIDTYFKTGKVPEQSVVAGFHSMYSLKEQNDLLKQNAKLKEVNRELRAQFKTTKFAKVDRKALNSFTKQLLKDYSSDVELEDARAALDGLYTYLANGENGESAMWQEAYDRAFEVSKSILESSRTMDDEMYRTYKALRDDLRKNGIALGAMGDGDLMGYESIDEFKRANRGRIKISENGTPIDIYYQALALDYPEFFDADEVVTPADQLLHIEEVLNKLQPMEVNPFSHNLEEAATWLANDILERFFELPQAKPTFADKAERKLTRQMIKDQEKLDRLREEKNAKIAELIAENRDKLKDAVTAERMAAGREMGKLKQKYAERAEKAGERKKASILRARIIRHARDMSQKLLRPSDKQHIPDNLRGPVAALLDAINMESQYTIDPITGKRQKNGDGDPTKRTAAFDELRKAYKAIIEGDGEDIVVDPAIELMLDDVLAMRDVRLADMTSHQLKQVWDVLRVMEHTVSNAGKLLSQAKYARTVEWADAFVSDTKTRRGRKGTRMEGFRLDLENPYTFFSHYGEAGKEVFRMLRDAQDEQQVMVENVRKQVQEIVDSKTVRNLEKEVHEFTTERGDKLTLTTAQVMEVYLLMKREQAQAHLMQGGIVQPEIESKKIKRGTDAILLTANDLSAITGKLDAKQKEIANKLQALTSTTLADYGNKASMKAYGYKKFIGTDYWPIKSAREGIHANVEKGGNNTRSIKNIGLAKTVMPGANNPLDIGGVFKTFASHAADMTDYAAWLCPMEDANRLFNFQFRDDNGLRTGRTIKGLLDRVGGKGAQDYWHRLMEDIQNGIKTQSDSELIKPINKIIGNTRGASVGANIRVIIQQPTAIFRAGAVLSHEAMFRGMFIGGGWKTALKHSPIAMRKEMGGFDISSPMQMNEILFDSKTKLQRFNEAMMWGAGRADAVTWGRIWNACESEVMWDRKDLAPRSDAFYDAVNELFTEVVDQSQVVDGVLQRSQAMRSNNALLNQATAFMGEPMMAMNMMLRAYDGLINEQDAKKRGKAIKTFGRTAMALLITNVVNALAQSLVDADRDDEDDEYWKKFWNAFTGITGEEETAWEKATGAMLSGNFGSGLNPLGYIPFAKDILSIFQGYNVTRADADVMGDIINACQIFIGSVSGDGKKTIAYATKNLAQQVGKVFGISATNILRDVWGIARTIALETGNIQLQYEMEKAIYKVSNDGNLSRFVEVLYKAYQTDKDTYQHIYDDLIASGIDAEDIRDKMEKVMKKAENVKSVDDLEQRYLNPQFQSEYDSKMGTIQKNKLWSKASDAQRDKLEDNLYELIIGSKDGEKLQEKIDGGKSVGLDDTEYLLYRLALDMYDQPTENGKMGTFTQDEAEAAIAAIAGLTDKERAYLWQSTNKGWKEDKNPWR